jgi:agmatinase
MSNKNFQTFFECGADYNQSNIVLMGAPFDSTASNRPGARFASKCMRMESDALESFSPYQNLDLRDFRVCDAGDMVLPFGDAKAALAIVSKNVSEIIADRKLPFVVGGEHLVTVGAVGAAAEKYPDLCLIHLDAHADLREQYLGVALSHACVVRRCWEMLGDGRIFQFGIRSGEREEFEWAELKGHTKLQRFNFDGLDETLKQLGKKPVYLTLDLDILDPSAMPGTGTPEAGGVGFLELLEALLTVCRTANVIGCDVVELSPLLDASGCSTALACKIVRELVLCLAQKNIQNT